MKGFLSFLFRQRQQPGIKSGDLCTVDDGEGFYRVSKILVVDRIGVHVRLYKNKWRERPESVDPNILSLGGIHDKDGYGIGHMPLTKSAFAAWKPIVFAHQKVVEEELDGYEIWKSSGSYFGDK
jgi:hypothetical protein